MSRVIAVVACGFTLAACSMSMPSFDFFKSTPAIETLRLESEPPGADARTAQGQSCRTPCELAVPAAAETSPSRSRWPATSRRPCRSDRNRRPASSIRTSWPDCSPIRSTPSSCRSARSGGRRRRGAAPRRSRSPRIRPRPRRPAREASRTRTPPTRLAFPGLIRTAALGLPSKNGDAQPQPVMRGLAPRIHVFVTRRQEHKDDRDNHGHHNRAAAAR